MPTSPNGPIQTGTRCCRAANRRSPVRGPAVRNGPEFFPGKIEQLVRVGVAAGQHITQQFGRKVRYWHRGRVWKKGVVRRRRDRDQGVVDNSVRPGDKTRRSATLPWASVNFSTGWSPPTISDSLSTACLPGPASHIQDHRHNVGRVIHQPAPHPYHQIQFGRG